MMVRIERAEEIKTTFVAPPSKSITHRALITSALAEGYSFLRRPLLAEDTSITRNILSDWGISMEESGEGIRIAGSGGTIRCTEGRRINVRDSGTSMRFFTSLSLLCNRMVILEGSSRMHQRPIGPLVEALVTLGARITYLGQKGFPPLRINGSLKGGDVVISGEESSQYISSILLAAPYAAEDITITCLKIPVSRAYIDTTLSVMDLFGAQYEREGYLSYTIHAGKLYQGREYLVEGDYSSASYFLALPAICGGSVLVQGLNPCSTQGDRLFLESLSAMGCMVRWNSAGVEVCRENDLTGITVDMSSSPDTVQTLCMVAACARTPTTITGIAHLRLKESDRVMAIAEVLRTLGGKVQVSEDSIVIYPAPLRGGIVDPRNDHRTAMSAAILGLGIGGVTILQAECVNKSFPEFWSMLREAGLL